MPAVAVIKCGCCREPLPDSDAVFEPELKIPVCIECEALLIKAGRWLTAAGLYGCTRNYAKGSNG